MRPHDVIVVELVSKLQAHEHQSLIQNPRKYVIKFDQAYLVRSKGKRGAFNGKKVSMQILQQDQPCIKTLLVQEQKGNHV